MNRALIFGIAIFFAVVGIALMGGENKAFAGHGCHGCHGCHAVCDGCVGACAGPACHDACHCAGRQRCHGLFNRCHGRHRCHGRQRCHGLFNRCHGCHAVPACHCAPACGGVIEGDYVPETEAPPAPAAASTRAPFGFHTVQFRR